MDDTRIYEKLDEIDRKLDLFIEQQTRNTTDIAWIKRIGISLAAVLGFLVSQIYVDLQEQQAIIKNEQLYNTEKKTYDASHGTFK